MKKISLSSPAKINLDLQIGKKEKNGLHEISTHIQKISLQDDISLLTQPSEKNKVSLILENKNNCSVPTDSTNIAVQAAEIFLEHSSLSPQKIEISLVKKIPVCAGLGGGSSNAGTVLRGLCSLFPNNIPKNIVEIAHSLGSDVPFFFYDFSAAFVQGTGEKIEKISPKKLGRYCVVQPKNVSYSTSWAYEKWDEKSATQTSSHSPIPQSRLHSGHVSGGGQNDFQALLLPEFSEFQKIENIFKPSTAEKYGLCGSGSAWYAFFSDKRELQKTAEKFEENEFYIFLEE